MVKSRMRRDLKKRRTKKSKTPEKDLKRGRHIAKKGLVQLYKSKKAIAEKQEMPKVKIMRELWNSTNPEIVEKRELALKIADLYYNQNYSIVRVRAKLEVSLPEVIEAMDLFGLPDKGDISKGQRYSATYLRKRATGIPERYHEIGKKVADKRQIRTYQTPSALIGKKMTMQAKIMRELWYSTDPEIVKKRELAIQIADLYYNKSKTRKQVEATLHIGPYKLTEAMDLFGMPRKKAGKVDDLTTEQIRERGRRAWKGVSEKEKQEKMANITEKARIANLERLKEEKITKRAATLADNWVGLAQIPARERSSANRYGIPTNWKITFDNFVNAIIKKNSKEEDRITKLVRGNLYGKRATWFLIKARLKAREDIYSIAEERVRELL